MTHITPNVVQQNFRARNDDGTETSATWKAALGTNWTQLVDETFRLRVLIEETAGGAANNYNYVAEFSLNGGAWTLVNTTSPIRFGTSANVTAGQPTTQQIGAGAFVAGEITMDDAPGNVSLDNQQTEMEYVLLLDGASLSDGDTIQIRATNAGTPIDGYTLLPTITVSKAASGSHELVANNLVTGAPVLGSPALGQAHELTALSITTGAPTLGKPALAQAHTLVANNLVTGAPVLGSPTLTEAGPTDQRAVFLTHDGVTVEQPFTSWTDELVEWTATRGALPYDTALTHYVRTRDGTQINTGITVEFPDPQEPPNVIFAGAGA